MPAAKSSLHDKAWLQINNGFEPHVVINNLVKSGTPRAEAEAAVRAVVAMGAKKGVAREEPLYLRKKSKEGLLSFHIERIGAGLALMAVGALSIWKLSDHWIFFIPPALGFVLFLWGLSGKGDDGW